MPLAVIHADEMSKDFGGRRSDERFGNRFSRRAHSAKAVCQRGCDDARARRHPEPEIVVVIERLAGHQISVIGVWIGVSYSSNWILWKEHLISSFKKWEWAVGSG